MPILLVVASLSGALAQTPAENTPDPGLPVVPKVANLTKLEMDEAVRTDEVTIPVPGEFFAAIGKEGRPNWSIYYRKPIPMTFPSRPQMALNLGGLIADGYIAVEAQDGQQVKNIGKDIIVLAKALGVSQEILSRGNSITEFADNNEWNALKEELEATQNDVRTAMAGMEDQDLVMLVNLGGWIRGTEVVSGVIAQNYTSEQARILRQPALVGYICRKMDELPAKLQADPLIKELRLQLGQVQKLIAYPRDHTPTADEVMNLRRVVSALTARISQVK